ncbi:tyrosine-type recombinase/integrase [Desulfosporosinus fructosivorans]|nr:tyrosine-type recombinase/integrase [Desulfosporosinus fructosivorans]
MNNCKSIDILAEDFLAYKRGIGYQYITSEIYMNGFVKYILLNYPNVKIPNKDVIRTYLDTKKDYPGALYGLTAVLREFSRYLLNQGYENVYVIPPKRMPKLCPEPPYFFTEDEIFLFLIACDSVKTNRSFKGRECVLPALFRILYCCGLRCKEVRKLLCSDVHLSENYIDILQSKGAKSRRLFISWELSDYLEGYNQKIENVFPGRTYFFPRSQTDYYTAGFISENFKRHWRQAFPDWDCGISRPRAYDFRHHFVWANLNRWAKEGTDMNAMLPYLVRYMGHQHLSCTLYYFRFVPEFFPVFTKLSESLEDILPEVPHEEE